MTTYRGALTRAFETAAQPSRRNIIDILTDSHTTCTACHQPGAIPRTWDTPHGEARGWYCDNCEIAVQLAKRHLRAGLVTQATQTIQRVAL